MGDTEHQSDPTSGGCEPTRVLDSAVHNFRAFGAGNLPKILLNMTLVFGLDYTLFLEFRSSNLCHSCQMFCWWAVFAKRGLSQQTAEHTVSFVRMFRFQNRLQSNSAQRSLGAHRCYWVPFRSTSATYTNFVCFSQKLLRVPYKSHWNIQLLVKVSQTKWFNEREGNIFLYSLYCD